MGRPFGKACTGVVGALVTVTLGAGCSDPVAPGPPEGALEVVVDGLSSPVDLTAPAGDDRLFVVEQAGRILVIEADTVRRTPFLDVTALTNAAGERGLLGMAFHPAYGENGYFYVNYTNLSGHTRIVRYTTSSDPNVADAGSATTILAVPQPYSNHNGGKLAFGPDGMLYVGLGDGGDGGDPLEHGQNRATLLGAMLRLDVDGGEPYEIPADNPFAGHATAAPEVWAYGFRNPWRFSFDRTTGDLWIADVGQGGREEVDMQPAASAGGENYGWRIMEGTTCYSPRTGCDQAGLTLPVHEYDHDEGCSITGGYVYRGRDNPTLRGRYFYADYCRTWIRSFRLEGGAVVGPIDHSADFGAVPSITSFGEDGAGELYVVSQVGTIYRVVEPS